MIKTILFFLALGFMLSYLAGTKINFKPFSIKFNEPALAIGVILICIGLFFCFYSFYSAGYDHGRGEEINNITGPVKTVKP
jgi:hypothetical protein